MRKIVVASIAILLALSLTQPVSNAVTNPDGKATDSPWLASIWVKQVDGSFYNACAGSLISDRAILTAAHCVVDRDVSFIRLDMNPSTKGKILQVSNRIIHIDYSTDGYLNDIALLVLTEPVRDVESIKLPPVKDQNLRALESLSIIGWGEDEKGNRPIEPKISEQLDMTTSASNYYDRFNAELLLATGRTVSVGSFSGACRGDSGGPLLSTFGSTKVLLGIVSYGAEDCNAKKPSVYTRLSAYLDWVEQALNAIK